MNIVVNGRPMTIDAGATIADLLDQLDLGRRVAAVEHNGEALAATDRARVVLQAGDRVELVRATAGG